MRRDHDWVCPGEAILLLAGTVAVHGLRPGGDQPDLAGAMVVALQAVAAAGRAADRADIHDIVVVGAHGDVAALAGAGNVAIAPGDGAVMAAARHRHAGVILLSAVDVIGCAIIGSDMVELGGWLIVDRRPCCAAVERDFGAAVVAVNHAARVARVDPQIVIVAMRRGDLGEGLATVSRFPEIEVVDVDRVRILRVGGEVHVVPGARDQLRVVADLLPVRAVVIRAV